MTRHVLEATRATLHGSFAADLPPALRIASGDSVSLRQIPDVAWGTGNHEHGATWRPKIERGRGERDAGPAMLGPIWVEGVEAGDTLAVRFDAIVPGAWGWTMAAGFAFNRRLHQAVGLGETQTLLLWELDREARCARAETGHVLPLAPFPGTIGLCPPGEGWHLGWHPTRHGGNMDWALLGEGVTLYLPVGVEGGLLSVGDTHARQGDGEVSGTAIECMMEQLDLTIWRADDISVTVPTVDTGEVWGTLGVSEELERAVEEALSAMLDLLVAHLGVTRGQAMALGSAMVDVRTAQLVNGVQGAYASWRPGLLG